MNGYLEFGCLGAVGKAVENAAEVVENAAEMAEKILEEVANELPVDGPLKDAIQLAECATKEVAKDAELTISFIHKVFTPFFFRSQPFHQRELFDPTALALGS